MQLAAGATVRNQPELIICDEHPARGAWAITCWIATGRFFACAAEHDELARRGQEAASVTKSSSFALRLQMNEYDSDKMADLLRAAKGFEITDQPENAT